MRKRRPSADVFPAASRSGAVGRALANVSLFPAPTGGARIKTLQAFSITIAANSLTGTATLSPSVSTTWSFILPNGTENGHQDDIRQSLATLDLTNSTTVTATRAGQDSTRTLIVKGMVVEWEPGSVKSVQQVAITIGSGNTSNTQTISSVTTAKSMLVHTGSRGGSGTEIRSALISLVLTNATTVTATRTNSTNAGSVTGAVVEFN